jgi:pre-mRNA-splicing factor CWC22
MIEGLFAARKQNFSAHPAVIPELDLVEEEDQICHSIGLDDDFDIHDELNYFHPDPDFVKNEGIYAAIKKELLGEGDSSEEGDESGDESGSDAEEEEKKEDLSKQVIEDRTSTDAVKLRLNIYLTIMSSLDFEECTHKMLQIKLSPGQEVLKCFFDLLRVF